MVGTPEDFEALERHLREHPDARSRLQQLLTGDAEQRLAGALADLTEQVGALTGRVDALAGRMDELAKAQIATERRLDALTEQVSALTDQMSTLTGHVDWLRGDAIERRYRERAGAYLGRIARRLRLLTFAELDGLLEPAVAAGTLTEAEAGAIRLADAVLHGRLHDGSDGYLVLEASVGVGLRDVTRARERADLLARVGGPTVAVVAGELVNPDADEAAHAMGVWQVTNGVTRAPQAA